MEGACNLEIVESQNCGLKFDPRDCCWVVLDDLCGRREWKEPVIWTIVESQNCGLASDPRDCCWVVLDDLCGRREWKEPVIWRLWSHRTAAWRLIPETVVGLYWMICAGGKNGRGL